MAVARGLGSVLVAALGTGDYVVVNNGIGAMADSLGSLRLTLATAFSVGAMVVWIIAAHELWERPSGRVARERAVLYNVVTVLTLTLV